MRRLLVVLAAFVILSACRTAPEPEIPPAAPAPAVPEKSYCRYIDKTGKVVIEPAFLAQEGFDFKEGLAGVKNREGKLGYIDKTGKLVIPFKFQDGTNHSEGHAGVLKDGMCGYIDLQGRLVVPLKYDSVVNFRDGWGAAGRNKKFTFVNGKGEEIGRMFAEIESFSEGLAAVAPIPVESIQGNSRPRFGFIDVNGTMVIPAQYEDAEPFSNGLAAVKQRGKWGYIDKSGTAIVPPQFDLAGPFHEGMAQVNIGPKMGYIDTTGKIVIEPRFESDQFQSDPDEKPVFIGQFVDGLAAVRHTLGAEAEAGWGFIDKSGKFVIPPIYEDAYMFSEGLASVKKDGKWGFIDPSGKMVIPPAYDGVNSFNEGLAIVRGY